MGHVQKKLSDPDDLESGVVGGMTQGQVGKANSTNRIPCTGHRACTRRSKAGTTATLPVWPGGRQSNNRKNKYIFFNITSSKKEKCRVF